MLNDKNTCIVYNMASETEANDTSGNFRELLENEARELRERLNELGLGDGEERLQFDSNFADSSQVTAERAELERLGKELKDALGEVEKALEKIEAGTYGICEACKEKIDPQRLEAMPAVKFCIKCASKR